MSRPSSGGDINKFESDKLSLKIMILPFKPESPVKIICPSSDIVAILWAKESAFISTLTGVIWVILSPPGLARVCTAWLASWWGTPGWIYK